MSDTDKTIPDPEEPNRSQDNTLDTDPEATIAGTPGIQSPGEEPGTRIGRYKLVRTLGEGGFGTVFLAEQLEPVSREVALKVIKLGMDTKQVIGRFEAERQALAMMDHPGIAKVFDAGTTDAGRPYFVMELVKGERITKYCDRNRLRTRDRLKLFNQVCEAVQHAHQKGIIHRDIKPSNVLVSEVDGKPVPKVIDFGIAKATSQRLTEKTVFTQQAQLIGTPAYMSPEQAEVTEIDIDTRSDIYSLGVLLYEILSGATPFDSAELLSAGYGEIQRIIKEVDPPLPSSRVSGLGDILSDTADHRQLRGEQLVKRLKGELDWIVMKCLEKDRVRRYETANGLARDVDRFLSNEPVAASPPSRSYRLKKLIVRNRAVFAAGSAMVLLMAAGVVGTSVGLVRAKQAESEAVIEAQKSNQVATFLTDMLEGVGPSAARGRDTEMLEEILHETHEKIGVELADQPEVEGNIRSYLGTTYFDMGKNDKALEQFALALEKLTSAHGENHEDVAKQYSNLGLIHEALQDFEKSEEVNRRALALRLEIFGEVHEEVGVSKLNLANLLVNDMRYAEAEPLLLEALAIQRQTLGEEHEDIAISLNSLGNLMQHLERYDEAGPYYDEALAMHTKLLGEDHPYVITDGVNLGWLSYNLGDFEAASTYFGNAVKIGRRVYGDGHPKLIEILKARADSQTQLGQLSEAEALYREAWTMSEEVHGPDSILTSEVIDSLSEFLEDQERYDESDQLQEKVLAIQRSHYGRTHGIPVATQHNLAYAWYKREEFDKGLTGLRFAREAYVEAFGLESAKTAQAINNLGRTLRDRGELTEAVTTLTEAMEIRKKVLGEDHLHVQVVNYDLAMTHRFQGRFEEAEARMEEVLVGYYAHLDSTHWVVGQALSELAQLKLDMNKPEEAADPARRGRDIVVGFYGQDSLKSVPMQATLIAALGRSGKAEEANQILESQAPLFQELSPRKGALAKVLAGRQYALNGQFEEGESFLKSAYMTLHEMHGNGHHETQRSVGALVALYEKWAEMGSSGARSKAEDWIARLIEP